MGSSRRKQHKHKGRHRETVFSPSESVSYRSCVKLFKGSWHACQSRTGKSTLNGRVWSCSRHLHAINLKRNTREGDIWLWIFPPFIFFCVVSYIQISWPGGMFCSLWPRPPHTHTHTQQPRRDIRRNEKEKNPKKCLIVNYQWRHFFSPYTHMRIFIPSFFSLYFFAIFYPGH